MLKIYSHDILFQEVPDEVSLALAISNCPYKCRFCHTPELQEDVGGYWQDIVDELLMRYASSITCVLFLGGDSDMDELEVAAKHIKDRYPKLKTAVYLGSVGYQATLENYFDYIKIGPYIHEKGGLNSPTTNQIMYQFIDNKRIDITRKFQK